MKYSNHLTLQAPSINVYANNMRATFDAICFEFRIKFIVTTLEYFYALKAKRIFNCFLIIYFLCRNISPLFLFLNYVSSAIITLLLL